MKPRKIQASHFLLLLILGVCGIYLYFFSFIDFSYSPYYGDEFFYFKNAESFAKSLSFKAPFTYSGFGSRLWGVDAHGPGYPLLYGFIAKLTGWYGPLIPLVNFSFVIGAIVLLVLQKETSLRVKFLQVVLILGSPITLFYSFSFLPELIQIAGGILLFLQFKRYHKSQNRQDFLLLISLIFVLGLIRSTWFFGLVGLMVFPEKINWKLGFGLILLALGISYGVQISVHEQVPNTFSGVGELIQAQKYTEVMNSLFFNVKRNIYFAMTYTEGKFYTVQKIWMLLSVLLALIVFRKDRVTQVGLVIFGVIFLFTMVLYKNYDWVEFRMYSPMVLFINLSMLATGYQKVISKSLVVIGVISFILILPLCEKIINYRVNSEMIAISNSTQEKLLELDQALILIDRQILKDYALDQLPIRNSENRPIRYILPYYEIKMLLPTHHLLEEDGQLKVSPVKILSQ
ncbi:hypothetical protein LV84_04176 [Algoriphagus ratkowskyi]|uniref:Dolichyl-phosphate-mannose-protein mannosyltransferase n=1 Tax=Algoriphagus ratkowskyi TaxID=57028 RepID=A0A2W7QN88_9BACT|nr:hypothetical protein [Algoriphagus ratkowskyi]PZX49784.1 hypothetical protein LV84_04176 [Algoriphagus ratkowskyi]TXD75496.1 hypothetical protein ESW18_20425 [Algoriphagus ratkowskyi]